MTHMNWWRLRLASCNKRPGGHREPICFLPHPLSGSVFSLVYFSSLSTLYVPALAPFLSISDCYSQTPLGMFHQSSLWWSYKPWPTPTEPTPFWKAQLPLNQHIWWLNLFLVELTSLSLNAYWGQWLFCFCNSEGFLPKSSYWLQSSVGWISVLAYCQCLCESLSYKNKV